MAKAKQSKPSNAKYDRLGRTPKQLRPSPREALLASAASPDVPRSSAQVVLPPPTGPPDDEPIAADLLVGAGRIAKFTFGDNTQVLRRRVYTLFEAGAFPAFKWGGNLCARRSTLRAYVHRIEHGATAVMQAAE
jgi:hypothetical protein